MAGQIEPIARMAQQLSRLPGIGAKTAQRLAYHIVSLPEDQVHELASAIWQGRKAVKYCSICGNYTVEDPCPICADEKRHNGVICVVRDPRDVAAMERMRDFKGCYHVLHGTISPMEGIGPEDIRIRELLARIGYPRGHFGDQSGYRRRSDGKLHRPPAQADGDFGHAHRARPARRRRSRIYRRGDAGQGDGRAHPNVNYKKATERSAAFLMKRRKKEKHHSQTPLRKRL